jgi:serine/threonine protein kinase
MASADTTLPASLGNYDILSKIAEGGMGTVYKARYRPTGEIVALKVIAAATAKNPVLLQRFEREFIAAKVLDHPNVVKALDYCGTGPHPFLVMEFVDGESLGQRLERCGPLPEDEAIRLITQVCEGLQRAHKQGLVHRDVKPDNILVTRDGVAKLTDLGLVKDAEGDLNLTKTGRGLGTPHYMAPEQFRNAKNVDVRGDIYSLGATLYALVTGVVPFQNSNPLDCWMKKIRNEFPAPKELNPALSDRVDWAIRRAMSAEPDRRPSSCREFIEDLTGQSRQAASAALSGRLTSDAADIWYMVYKDETGATHTGKATTEGIRRALREHRLGDPALILVSRSKTGPFASLASVPEFRDLVVSPAPLTPEVARSSPSGILAKSSAGVPQPGGTDRSQRQVDSDAVDLGATPSRGASASASRSGRSTGPASSRQSHPPTSPSARRIPPVPPGLPMAVDPHAETLQYIPQTPPDTPVPPARRTAKPAHRPTRPTTPSAHKPFDWTPLLIVLVMLVSAAIGYVIFSK